LKELNMQIIVTLEHYEQAWKFRESLCEMDVQGRLIPGFNYPGICPLARAARETFPGWHCSAAAGTVFLHDDEGNFLRRFSIGGMGFRLVSAFDDHVPWPYGNREIAISLTDKNALG
jgi:hypothetical protein